MSQPPAVPDRSGIATESANPAARDLDALPTIEALACIQQQDALIHDAIAAAREPIARAIDLIASRLAAGGRLFYVGAGTSGRLAVLDAVELPPTFQSDPDQVQGLLAGGQGAMFRSVEGAEDDAAAAGRELDARGFNKDDVVFAISAGGTTPFARGAIEHARGLGVATVFFACVPFDSVPDPADISIRVLTGPEVLQGSTRMKAGSATKLVLNSISTLVMAKLGKVYDNRMVDVNTAGNVKLLDRGIRLVADLASIGRADAEEALSEAGGSVKLAVVMRRCDLSPEQAANRLARAHGSLRDAFLTK